MLHKHSETGPQLASQSRTAFLDMLPDSYTAKADRMSLWYRFEEQVKRLSDSAECIWSRTGVYDWSQTYAQACRYAQFLLSNGVQSGDLVAVYLQNSPEFMFVMLASWCIGTAPAMINYNLASEGLIHCLKLSGSKVVLVDEDSECRARIEACRERIEGELGMKIIVLDEKMKHEISSTDPKRPEDKYRAGMKGEFPMCLIYTRSAVSHQSGLGASAGVQLPHS